MSIPPRWINVSTLAFLLASLGPAAVADSPTLPEFCNPGHGIAGGRVSCNIQDYGYVQYLSLLVQEPKQPPGSAKGDTPLERARSVTRAILDQEAGPLDLPDLTELREMDPVLKPDGFIGIGYQRYIGGVQLAFMNLYFRFNGDGTLYQMEGSLLPVPPELREAVQRERLSADQIKWIVAADLGWPVKQPPEADGQSGRPVGPPQTFLRLTNAQILEMMEQTRAAPVQRETTKIDEPVLMAYPKPPHLRWGVMASPPIGTERWSYLVDGFTGEILRKAHPPRMSSRSSRPAAPAPRN
jgi:hypothetical protein